MLFIWFEVYRVVRSAWHVVIDCLVSRIPSLLPSDLACHVVLCEHVVVVPRLRFNLFEVCFEELLQVYVSNVGVLIVAILLSHLLNSQICCVTRVFVLFCVVFHERLVSHP